MSRFPFNPEKATDVAGLFLEKANGSMNILKLAKRSLQTLVNAAS